MIYSGRMIDIAQFQSLVWGAYRPTPLISCPDLARLVGIKSLFLKLESERPLGNFKSLGGTFAALVALGRAAGHDDPAGLIASPPGNLPRLVCASDGNHGLAVAAAARRVGASASIYLPRHVDAERVARIREQAADVVRIDGTYDDAVLAATEAAEIPGTILVADTSAVLTDEVVGLVMKGYELIATELLDQAANRNFSHLFVQAGVGGLAAALAGTIRPKMVGQRKVVIVEPENAACVGAALEAGRAVSLEGELDTGAAMLSCGLASTPALEILLANDADAISVSEPCLEEACALMEAQGINTTPSGAAGLAGLLGASRDPALRRRFGLEPKSAALLIVSEGRPRG